MRGRLLARRLPESSRKAVAETIIYQGSGVSVPTAFLGMHTHFWPRGQSGNSPHPTFGYGTHRTHDYKPVSSGNGARMQWSKINYAAGLFDWTYADELIDTVSAEGKEIIWTIYGTPTWAAPSTTPSDAYGTPGGAYAPSVIGGDGLYTDLKNFVTALVTRYNTDSVRNNGGAKKIKFLEVWNEPKFSGNGNPANYFWGTADELARMTRTVNVAARAVDPSILILGPGFTGISPGQGSGNINQYLLASDGAGGTPKDWIDGVAFHPYDSFVINSPTTSSIGRLAAVRQQMQAGGLPGGFPVYVTEQGYEPTVTAWQELSETEKAALLQKNAAALAALGVKRLCYFSYDLDYLGMPVNSQIISQALDQIHSSLAGSTITSCVARVLSSGKQEMVISLLDGRVLVW